MTCSVDGCARPYCAKGYCKMHYRRVTEKGHPGPVDALKYVPRSPSDDIEARLLDQSIRVGDCLVWQGYKIPSGYGIIHWRGRTWVCHRAMWTAKVGPIPTDDDWTIDHLCRNRACVNVEHMEVVTRIENSRRGGGLELAHAKTRAATSCPNGHEYTEENTRIRPNGGRICRTCWAAHARRHRARIASREIA
jgi:hypothetical protein